MAVQVLRAFTPGEVPRYASKERRGKLRGRRDPRAIEDVDAVTAHHLGPHLSAEPRPGQTVAERALWRARRQPYHVWVQPGLVVVPWDPRVVTWHGNALNSRSLGLVVAGHFPALEAGRGPRHDDPEPYFEALRRALEVCLELAPHARHVFTHSQAAAKPADPGEAVAREIARICPLLASPLAPSPDTAIGKGRPWPAQWRVPA